MATINNSTTENGDVLLIRAQVPIIGLIYLTDYIDSTTGEDGQNYFLKEFRFSIDGVNFNPWQPLTFENISAVQVRAADTFLIEYRYTRLGSGPQALTFNEVQVRGGHVRRECGPTYKQSVFADFFSCSDTEVLGWAINVTEKLYRKGLMPSFVQRAATSSSLEDRDYLDFWRSVAQFFGLIVVYARRLESFHQHPELLRQYLVQWGSLGVTGQSLESLNYLLENSRDQLRKRGSGAVLLPSSASGVPDGELLRLIGYESATDEFIVNVVEPIYAGWCVGSSSPTYGGVGSQRQLNKLAADAASFGTDPLKVDANLTYELSFTVKMSAYNEIGFGCRCFDQYGNELQMQNPVSGRPLRWFFEDISPNQNGVEYQVRALLFAQWVPNKTAQESRIPFGRGTHLRLPVAAVRILPELSFSDPAAATVTNVRVAPCSSPYSVGFVDSSRLIQTWMRNRNRDLSPAQLRYQIAHYLLPYNATYLPIFVEEPPKPKAQLKKLTDKIVDGPRFEDGDAPIFQGSFSNLLD